MRCLCVALICVLSGCAAQSSCNDGLRASNRVDLYFGLDIPGGGTVTALDWQRFNDEVLSPAFPEGLTVVDANGLWRDKKNGGPVHENVKVVTVIGSDIATARRVAETYRAKFHQDSVGLTTTPLCAKF